MKKTALITGASRGIGAGLAIELARRGWYVAMNYYNNKEKAENVRRRMIEAGGDGAVFQADVRSSQAVSEMCREVGEVDLLINNAGIAQQKLFCDITEQEWDDMFAVHVKGAFNTIKCVLPGMICRGSGEIINISSICSEGFACEVHYSAAKAALSAMTRALAREHENSGVCIRSVELGAIDTDMHEKLKLDYEQMTGMVWEENLPLMTVKQAVEKILEET